MNKGIIAVTVILVLFSGISCIREGGSDLSRADLIPEPVTVSSTGGYFNLRPSSKIYISGESAGLEKVASYLAGRLRPSTGFTLDIVKSDKAPGAGNIFIALSDTVTGQADEGYELSVTKRLVSLTAGSAAGLFRGVQTIRQLLPAKIEQTSRQEGPWKIATGSISDHPVYAYRGAMLDVARHFFSIDDVKRFIDLIAFYKMNTLHLHLTDDQGWRIEIRSWPELTKKGGSTEVGGGPGGYYTQEQYSELVKYAAGQFITIVPEIDMPGHINAALASYPELNCNGKATKLYTGTEVGFSTLCTNKAITYKFVDDVIGELSAITPGPFIHIGGDESHVTRKEDYIPFVRKVQEIVVSHGKRVIGWDEISLSQLVPNTVAQYWSNRENAERAVSQGAMILMSPASRAYIDMKYDSTTTLGLHWAGYVEVDSSYMWDPATLVKGITKENIIGVEAALWTETISNMKDLEYMVFPRLPGIAEVGWSPASVRKWSDYRIRLGNQGERFRAMKINYYPSKQIPWN